MSRPGNPPPCALAVAILRSPAVPLQEVLSALGEAFGPTRAVSREVPFTQTRYYEREMGPGLLRAYAGLCGTWDPGDLADLKLRSNELEARWAVGERRKVNLDPGLVNLGQMVLATGKPAAHRVYVGRGIYGEVEYIYERRSFRPLPWTYPDYRGPETIAFFNELREHHGKSGKEAR